MLERYPDLLADLAEGEGEALSQRLRQAETIGRPLGSSAFVQALERAAGRRLATAKAWDEAAEG